MPASPLEVWQGIYPYEESIASETQTLDELHVRLNNAAAIEAHIANMKLALSRVETDTSALYAEWCLDPKSYRYGSDAYYQSRIVATLRHLQDTPYRRDCTSETICARQILKPSAFNGSPRIKRVFPFVFLIFPAPTVYWMYEIMGMIAASAGCGSLVQSKIKEYLTYLIAARSFERWATHATAYAIDFLVDELANTVLQVAAEEDYPVGHELTPLSQQLVYAAEEFVISHELAHFALCHVGEGTLDVEVAADRRALEMMQSMNPGAFDWVEGNLIDVSFTPWLGYLALRLWTNVRLAAEIKVVPWVYEEKERVEREKQRIFTLWQERADQIDRVGLTRSVKTPKIFKEIVNASTSLIGEIMRTPIDGDEVRRIGKVARALALGDGPHLSERIFSDHRVDRTK